MGHKPMNADFTKDKFVPLKRHCWLRFKKHKWFLSETIYGVESESQRTYYRRQVFICLECGAVNLTTQVGFRIVDGQKDQRVTPPGASGVAKGHLRLLAADTEESGEHTL